MKSRIFNSKYEFIPKPWGKEFLFLDQSSSNYWIKKLFVKKGKQFSLQSHQKRSEIWIVLSGKIKAQKGKKLLTLKKGDCLKINKKEKHRICGFQDSVVLEVAFGQVSEKDIIRYEDDYGRIKTKKV